MTAGVVQMAKRRGGRPRKTGVDRQPDGRPRPEKIEPTPEMVGHRAADLARIIRLHPIPLAKRLSGDPAVEWYVGRLWLAGVITEAEKDAAHDYRQVIDDYRVLLLAPKRPGSVDMNRRDPSPAPLYDENSEADRREAARFRRIKHRYEAYWDALADCGVDVLKGTNAAMRDEEAPLHLLRPGLSALLRAGKKKRR